MLVLTCKNEEAVLIGDNIIVKIRSAEFGRARLCIDAPREIPIERLGRYSIKEDANDRA